MFETSEDLSQFGYRQQLRRSIRGFSSFALSFSLISMTTGVFAGFGFAIRQFGPAAIWSWILVAMGQCLVALVLAELAVHYPLSGYGYQWTSRLLNPHVGFFVGWALLLQFMTGFPGVCSALGEYAGPALSLPPKWITLALITAAALIHIFGIRLAAFLNDAGVIAELAGSLIVAIVLIALFGPRHPAPAALLTNTTAFPSGLPGGFAGFAASLLMGAWCLTGFEAAADLAEETHRPAVVVPRAVLGSLLASSLGGLLMIAGFLLAMPDLRTAQASSTPLSWILEVRLGPAVTRAVMLVVFVSIFACALASLASATRLLFSMARDGMLPASGWLRGVHPRRATPVNAILLVWLISCAVVVSLERLEVITSVSAIATYIGYAGIILAAIRGMRHKPQRPEFHLGPWRRVVGWAALAWVICLVAALAMPAVARLAVKVLGGVMFVGFLIYSFLVRARIRRGAAGPPAEVRQTGDDGDSVGVELPGLR